MSITPAQIQWSPGPGDQSLPSSPLYGDIYHAETGAWAQARHVFLAGNELPERWQGQARFVILETGFGLGNNFLATWAAWRADPKRCKRLVFISVEKHPLVLSDLIRAHRDRPADDDAEIAQQLSNRLCKAWPPLTPGLHVLDFEEPELPGAQASSGVTLLLGLGDISDLLPKLVASVDAFYLDGFAPAKNPAMWDEHQLSRLNRLAASKATVATWSVARGVREALGKAGFEVSKAPGFSSKRDMLKARYAPRHQAAPLPGGLWPTPSHEHHAIVIGAGLAGCAAAWALTQEGWQVTLIEQHSEVAQEASGNLGGLFHSIVHARENMHTRAHRAAALLTSALAGPWIRAGKVTGQIGGLLRLDPRLTDDDAQAQLLAQGLPENYVEWLSQAQAQSISELPVPSGAWMFKGGGWLHPAGYAQAFLTQAAGTGLLRWQASQQVTRLRRGPLGPWQALDELGQVLASAPCVVMCNAGQLGTLPLEEAESPIKTPHLPLSTIRGQVTWLPADLPDLKRPAVPVAGSGYALTLPDGRVLCGATTQEGDLDPAVRWADHELNLAQAERLGALPEGASSTVVPGTLHGRTGWRASTPDRLPLIGALAHCPPEDPTAPWPDQVRRVPRHRDEHGGLYVLGGLGSRGITWAALGARLLSHWVTGAPCPVESDLRDALDPARFDVRRQRLKSRDG